ncbi:hypothetical protein E1287_06255 [Actinomadura sp. KC06]|uniref:hypothetical protein n=1 Tax=Actinomadura sp. KC06 TaxID=2530369 RepID=UPI001044A180|nr:hypothetical protein [Actinomadura sp. KC06]TDD38149.1 hypothetical protein E1287_06255 [Actinomadura sp. KC06]
MATISVFAAILTVLCAAYQRRHADPEEEPEEWEEHQGSGVVADTPSPVQAHRRWPSAVGL